MYKIFKTIAFVLFAALSFAACDDVPAPYDDPNNKPGNPSGGEEEIITPKGSGTLADPYNVAGLLDFIEKNEDTAKGTTVVVEGVISSIKSLDVANYTRAQYYINDTKSATGQFYVYNGLYLDGANFTSNDQIKVGDKVLIEGTIDQYNGAFQIGQNSKILKLNDVGGSDEPGEVVAPKGSGTLADPYNVAGLVDFIGKNESTAKGTTVVVEGLISNIKSLDVSKYTRAQYYINDTESTNGQFYIYNGLYLDGANFTSNDQIKVGDKVLIEGTIDQYNGAFQIGQNSKILKLNNVGGSDEPGEITPGKEVTCAEARDIALALDDKATTTETYTVTGYITKIVGEVSRNQQTFWMADTKDGGEVFEAYWADLPEGTSSFVVGSKVKITGQIMRFGSVPEIKNATVEILELGEGGGSDEPDVPSGDGSVSISGTTVTLTNASATAETEGVTMVIEELGIDDKASVDGKSYSFSDGATVSIAKGEGTSAPTYYAATKGFRIYACNTLTFSASKTIAKIVMECDLYNGTSYVGNETATFSVEGSTAVYNNYNEEKKGGVQLRPKQITIYYAK